MKKLSCFKAYDIRGKLGSELDESIAYRIGRAFGIWLVGDTPKTVVLGSDIRITSESLKQALAEGLMDSGVNVIDLGMTGTEEVYFATFHLKVDGGVEVTASHNPIDYNGMKLVQVEAQPISGDTGLFDIQSIAEREEFPPVKCRGSKTKRNCIDAYIYHLLSYIDKSCIRPLRLVVNAGNGAAGHIIDKLEVSFRHLHIPVAFIKIHNKPDGTFPNGIPNPLLPESREDTRQAVINHKADMGIAWDGDFDRCFLFDEMGRFIEGYYIVGLLAEAFLKKIPKGKVIHDPRLIWNTLDIVNANQGVAIQSKTGHAFIKERMRIEDAIYGGEMSAHHYFRDFSYCDSGMIPWLLIVELVSRQQKTLSSLLDQRMAKFPCSGELNFHVSNSLTVIDSIKQYYSIKKSAKTDTTDGLSIAFSQWRFNLRVSNTEPVIRLNVESRGDESLLKQKTIELSQLIL